MLLVLPALSFEGPEVTEVYTQIPFPCSLSVVMENTYVETLILLTDIKNA